MQKHSKMLICLSCCAFLNPNHIYVSKSSNVSWLFCTYKHNGFCLFNFFFSHLFLHTGIHYNRNKEIRNVYFIFHIQTITETLLRQFLQIQEELNLCVKQRQPLPKPSKLCETLLNVNCVLHSILFHTVILLVLLVMDIRHFCPWRY